MVLNGGNVHRFAKHPYFDAPVMIDVMKRHIVVQCFSLCSPLFSSDFGDDAQCYI